MNALPHIETVTIGASQRVRRTVAYRVVANREEIVRFVVDPRAPGFALEAARAFLAALKEELS